MTVATAPMIWVSGLAWLHEVLAVSLLSVGETVLERVSRGDAGSESALVDRYGGLVWSIARRYCAGRAEAEDAVQEIMLDLWRSAREGRFDPGRGADTTFVAVIARRRLIDRLRKRRVTSPLPEGVEQRADESGRAEGAATPALGEDARAAAAALQGLSAPQQTAIRLAVLHGLTHEQVAEVTGLPLGTVKTHIRRGLIRLREAVLGGKGVER